ncbi:MAG: hypothetical protein PSV18_08240 [Methylobacter sp.]|nr:hypothetical protein [Candidatus Methylobacter titanis]
MRSAAEVNCRRKTGDTPIRHCRRHIVGQGAINRNERLDVLLARLRKKASAILNKSLPIKTAHMHGYAFIAAAITQ